MAARQARVLAGSASALAALMLALAGCAAAGHPAAATVPRPAGQTAAGRASPQTAARAATSVRLASPLLKCAYPVAPGPAQRAGGASAASAPAAQTVAHGGSASPIPLATAGQVTAPQVGVAIRSQPGLVVLCGPAAHCPPGSRAIYPRVRSGRRPRVLPPFVVACYPPGTPSPEPRLTPEPFRTPPLRTMPPSPAGRVR
jgi:hypothetical protein